MRRLFLFALALAAVGGGTVIAGPDRWRKLMGAPPGTHKVGEGAPVARQQRRALQQQRAFERQRVLQQQGALRVKPQPERRVIDGPEAAAAETHLVTQLPWRTSLPEALAEARKEGKMVFWVHMLGQLDGAT